MTHLVDKILRQLPSDVVSATDLSALLQGTAAARLGQIKRAVAAGQLLRLRRGLYVLAAPYRRRPLHPFVVAAQLVAPSYVSFESALSYHGLIPEAVYTTTSACLQRCFNYTTAVGSFAFRPIPARAFMQEVERVEADGQIFLMATPLKALTDLVYTNHLPWYGVEPLVKSMRIDIEDLHVKPREFEDLQQAFAVPRIRRFLKGLQKDLNS